MFSTNDNNFLPKYKQTYDVDSFFNLCPFFTTKSKNLEKQKNKKQKKPKLTPRRKIAL